MRKQRGIGQRLLYDAFADGGNGFGDGAHAAVVFCGEEKRAQERAMNAVAEFEFFGAHPSVELGAEFRGEFDIRPEKRVPAFAAGGSWGVTAGWRGGSSDD